MAGAAGLSKAHFSREFRRDLRRVPPPLPADQATRAGRSPAADDRLERRRGLLRGRAAERRLVHDQLQARLRADPDRVPGRASRPPQPSPRCRAASFAPTCGPRQHVSRRQANEPRLAWPRRRNPNERRRNDRRVSNGQVWVHDQEEALEFWTKKVGWEVRSDITMAELGGFRWLTVGAPGQDFSLALMAIPGPAGDGRGDEEAGRGPDVEGLRGHGLPDRRRRPGRATRSSRSRGVEFTEAPAEQPYGLDSEFRDPSGNKYPARQADRRADQAAGSRRISRPGALRADQRERLLLGDRQRRRPALARLRPGPASASSLTAGRGDAALGGAPEPGLPRDHHVDPASLGRAPPTVSASAPATATSTGRSPRATPGARGALGSAARPAARRATYEPGGIVAPGARPSASAGLTSAPGGTKLAGTRRTASAVPAAAAPIGCPAGSSAVATTTGRSGP